MVLFMSGDTDDAIGHHGVLDPGMRFIGKPFAAAELTRQVREVLDEATATGAVKPPPRAIQPTTPNTSHDGGWPTALLVAAQRKIPGAPAAASQSSHIPWSSGDTG